MKAVYRHEVSSLFTGMQCYVFGAFLLLFAGIYTMAINLNSGMTSFEIVLGNMSFIFLIIVPILTMRVIAEERRQKTDSLLYSLPISTAEVVVGKFFALLTVFAIPVAIIGIYPLILSAYGNVFLKASYCALIGFFLLGASLIALGMFLSSITESQAVAAGLCFAVLLVNYLIVSLSGFVSSTASASLIAFSILLIIAGIFAAVMTKSLFTGICSAIIAEIVLFILYIFFKDSFAGLFPDIMAKLSLFSRFNDIINGVFDYAAVIYYLSVSALMCFLTVQAMEKRRWS